MAQKLWVFIEFVSIKFDRSTELALDGIFNENYSLIDWYCLAFDETKTRFIVVRKCACQLQKDSIK